MTDPLRELIQRWRFDAGATYQTWFLWRERLKNFGSIRRGLQTVVHQIRPVGEMDVRYLTYEDLERNREAMARFGAGVRAIDTIAKRL